MKQILFYTEKTKDKIRFNRTVKELMEKLQNLPDGKFEIVIRKPIRTSKQNRAVHLFFQFIADELNAKDQYFNNSFFKEGFQAEWTSEMVKELIWRPVSRLLYNKEKTSELKTDELSKIADLIQANFAMRGVVLEFPSIETINNNFYSTKDVQNN